MSDKPCVFIQSNPRQHVGALVAEHALRRSSSHPDRFDVAILSTEDHPFLAAREGQEFLRDGGTRVWTMEDLQSFTPLRFRPPEVMGYHGRAVVIDPDVFAIADVQELLDRDMEGKAIVCRPRSGHKGRIGIMASSVMLLDCAKLEHWRCEEQFGELFAFERDYMDWVGLKLEPPGSIGRFEDEWNDFDHLTPRTKMLHTTKRQTQPWKTGLPIDFQYGRKRVKALSPSTWVRPIVRLRRAVGGTGVYVPHPDPKQEKFFFGLLRECVDAGIISEDLIRNEMGENHLRHDTLEVLDRTESAAT